jgi:hypothetical protein
MILIRAASAATFVSVLLILPLTAAAYPRKIPRIGLLSAEAPPAPYLGAFRSSLRELGYIEGRNIALEYRWARGQTSRLPQLAAEMVGLKVDLIVAFCEDPADCGRVLEELMGFAGLVLGIAEEHHLLPLDLSQSVVLHDHNLDGEPVLDALDGGTPKELHLTRPVHQEPPLPAKITAEQALHFATSLVRGEPNRAKIALTVLADKVRELV